MVGGDWHQWWQYRHRRRPEAKRLQVRAIDPDAHRKTLRNPDPVDRPRDLGQAVDIRPAIVGKHAEADRVDIATEYPAGIAHQVDAGGVARANVFQLGFTEIRHHIPVPRIDQAEHRLARRGELAGGGLEAHHAAFERCANGAVLDVQRGPGDLRISTSP